MESPTSHENDVFELGPVFGTLGPLPPGSHVAICLSSAPLRRQIQAAFLAEEYPAWLCVYASQDEPLDQVRRELESHGFPAGAPASRMRWIPGRDLYGDPLAPDMNRWTASIRQLFSDVRTAGLRGVRWTGDLPAAFARRGLYAALRELERSVPDQFVGPYTILWTYEEHGDESPRPLLEAIAAHTRYVRLPEAQARPPASGPRPDGPDPSSTPDRSKRPS